MKKLKNLLKWFFIGISVIILMIIIFRNELFLKIMKMEQSAKMDKPFTMLELPVLPDSIYQILSIDFENNAQDPYQYVLDEFNEDVMLKVRKGVPDGDQFMANCIINDFVNKNKKALIYCGIHHAFTGYKGVTTQDAFITRENIKYARTQLPNPELRDGIMRFFGPKVFNHITSMDANIKYQYRHLY